MKQSQSSEPLAERRACLRIPCALLIDLQMGPTVFRVELMNLSQSGIFVCPALNSASSSLVTAAVLKPGKPLRLHLTIAGSTEPHEARARVTRRSDFGIGVEFLELTPALAALIEQLVSSEGDADMLSAITRATLTVGET